MTELCYGQENVRQISSKMDSFVSSPLLRDLLLFILLIIALVFLFLNALHVVPKQFKINQAVRVSNMPISVGEVI